MAQAAAGSPEPGGAAGGMAALRPWKLCISRLFSIKIWILLSALMFASYILHQQHPPTREPTVREISPSSERPLILGGWGRALNAAWVSGGGGGGGGVHLHACGLVLRAGSSGIASFHQQEETLII